MTVYSYDAQGRCTGCKVLTPEEADAWEKAREAEREKLRAQMPQGATLPPPIVVTYTYDASGAIVRRQEGLHDQKPASDG